MLHKLSIISLLILFTYIQGFHYHLFNINTVIHKSLDDSLIHFIKINNVNYLRVKNTHSKYLILKYFHDKPKMEQEGNMEKGKLVVNLPTQIMIKNETEHIINFIPSISKHPNESVENNENQEKEGNEESMENKNYDIYELIRKNEKPILILNERKNGAINFKYLYLIKDKYNYITKYTFNYNNNNYRYAFHIEANSIDKCKTNWNIHARFRYKPNDLIEIYRNNIINWINYNIHNNVNNYYYKRYLLFKALNDNNTYE